MKKLALVLLAVVSTLAAVAETPDPGRVDPQDARAVERELNRVSNARAEVMIRVREQERELEVAWLDPRLSSETLDALRKRVLELERELAQARAALQDELTQHPEMQRRHAQLAADREALDALTRRRDALDAKWQRLGRPAQTE